MIKAARETDDITDIARPLKAEVESLLVTRSPLVGLTTVVSMESEITHEE